MKLVDLEGQFLAYRPRDGHDYYHHVETLAEADGVQFVCPKCYAALGKREGAHLVLCWFVGKVPAALEPNPGRWTPAGSGLHDLTFVPGVPAMAVSVLLMGGCNWHGFVRNGEATLT